MKLRVTRPRILFLHGLVPQSHHERSLARTVGEKSICSISLENSSISTGVFLLWSVCSVGLVAGTTYAVFIVESANTYVQFVACLGIFLVVGLLYLVASRIKLALLVTSARFKAQRMFKAFRPNMIVACSYGAAVALTMRIPILPIILFTPTQDRFAEYICDNPSFYSLHKFPYALICHGVADISVPFEDTLRLANTIPEDHCYLVSLDSDDSELRNVITDEEMRDILLFTYREGWITAFTLTAREMRSKDAVLDASLLPLKDIVSFATIALNRQRGVSRGGESHETVDETEGENIDFRNLKSDGAPTVASKLLSEHIV